MIIFRERILSSGMYALENPFQAKSFILVKLPGQKLWHPAFDYQTKEN